MTPEKWKIPAIAAAAGALAGIVLGFAAGRYVSGSSAPPPALPKRVPGPAAARRGPRDVPKGAGRPVGRFDKGAGSSYNRDP